jgi:hypothetical protein
MPSFRSVRGAPIPLAPLSLVAVMLAACATVAPKTPASPKTPTAASTSPSAPTVAAPSTSNSAAAPDVVAASTGARVLYREAWAGIGGVGIVCVDVAKHQLVLERSWNGYVYGAPATEKPVFTLDTIDYVTGARIERWAATEANAAKITNHGGGPVSGTFEEDLVRFAKMLQRCERPHEAANSLGIATTPDGAHLFYQAPANDGSGEDAFFVTDAAGKNARRFDAGLKVSYELSPSPDSKWAAFSGYKNGVYFLYVRGLEAKDPVVKVTPVAYPKLLRWSPQGVLYALASGTDQKHPCIHAVLPSEPLKAKSVYCGGPLGEDSNVTLSPDGKTARVSGSVRSGTSDRTLWIQLSDGKVLADVSINAFFGGITNDGVLLIPRQKQVLVLDLVAKKERVAASAQIIRLDENHWLDDHTLAAVAITPAAASGSFELVAIDASRPQ